MRNARLASLGAADGTAHALDTAVVNTLRATCLGLVGCFLLVACSSTSPKEKPAAEPQFEKLARFRIDVDPRAAEPFSFTRLSFDEAGEVGQQRQAFHVSVTSGVSLSGPGTWDEATRRLRGDVRITNGSGTTLDEPRIVITSVTTDSVALTFEGVDSGSGAVGSYYAYADTDVAGGINNGSAWRPWTVWDPDIQSFSFTVDVEAITTTPPSGVFPDGDDDSFNVEVNQPAGDDCDDTDPAKNPGDGTCTCDSDCSTCTNGCCEQACDGDDCTDGGATGVITCAACGCDVVGSSGSTLEVDCQPGSTCDVTCNEPGPDPGNMCAVTCDAANCTVDCESPSFSSDCGISCVNTATCSLNCMDGGDDCNVELCQGGASCTLNCIDTRDECIVSGGCSDGAHCDINCDSNGDTCGVDLCDDSVCEVECEDVGGVCEVATCSSGATCHVQCGGNNPDCGIGTCLAADCSVTCDDNISNNCEVGVCTSGSTCSVDCSSTVGGDCRVGPCLPGADCAVSCNPQANECFLNCSLGGNSCVLDCNGKEASRCSMLCPGGATPTDCGGDVYVCPGMACP